MSKKALILFAHGARDPRWAAPFQRLQAMTQASTPETTVELAFLEFMTPNLPDLVTQLVTDGVEEVVITPIFLGQGGHVLRDLPILLDELRGKYPQLSLKLEQAVGEEESVLHAIRDVCLRAVG
jgi:sirohydrochlorin cobaltochelatase